MSFYDHDDDLATMIRRVRLSKLDDSGTQQKGNVRGLKNDQLEDVVRIQNFGFSSNPPNDAEGVLLALGGRSDRAMLLGIEHKDHRPKGGEIGGTYIYDAFGNIASFVQSDIKIVHSTAIIFQVGGVQVVITSQGVSIVGGKVTHNARNIGSSHTHSGVTPGGGNTSIPNP